MLSVRAATEDGVDVVVTRSFNHTGPGQPPTFVAPSFARQLARIERGLQEPVLKVGNLDALRDLTDVRDVVRAYTALMASGATGEVYNVASGIGPVDPRDRRHPRCGGTPFRCGWRSIRPVSERLTRPHSSVMPRNSAR
jgi:nucleoside-diphosphate-sugar epimerase